MLTIFVIIIICGQNASQVGCICKSHQTPGLKLVKVIMHNRFEVKAKV